MSLGRLQAQEASLPHAGAKRGVWGRRPPPVGGRVGASLSDALDALQIKHLNSAATPAVISQFDYTYRPDRSIETMAVRQNGVTNTWTYGYDGANQLTAATLRNASQVILESNSYAYDKAGNRTQMGNTTTAPSNAEVNNLNQLLSLRDFGPTTFAGTVDEPATVTVNGQPARMTSNDGGAPYRFEAQVSLDAGTNLVSVQAKDGRNNTSTKNYSVSSSGAAKAFEYDGNGNLRFERQPGGAVIREYQWDQQNRLVKLIAGANESQFEYDGESRRTRIRELTNGTQTKDERFVWCGSRICQKRTGLTTVARRYFDNGFLQSTTKYFYTRDHLGSVREVVASNGTTVNARLVYDAWGRLTETGTVQSDFTYTGHYLHRPSALNLAQYRGYDAGLGRWLSRDPIGLAGGLNLYGYVGNDPLNFVDRDGRLPDYTSDGPERQPSGSGAGPLGGSQLVCIAIAISLYWTCKWTGQDENVCLKRAADLIELCYRRLPPPKNPPAPNQCFSGAGN
jgi:RHS repeat-associated protein